MNLSYTEKNFEEHVVDSLVEKQNFIKTPLSYGANNFDKNNCLLEECLINFITKTQLSQYDKLKKFYGDQTNQRLKKIIHDQISYKGLHETLRSGVTDNGIKFNLIFFKPNSKKNLDLNKNYKLNNFRAVRQLYYSNNNKNSIDICIFINGIPVFTFELKNKLTNQTHVDAIKQYIKTRLPTEKLFNFNRCLAHFALGTEKVFFTTRVDKENTFFLPFNKSNINLKNLKGILSSFFWQEVLTKENILDLIQNFVHLRTEEDFKYNSKKNKLEKIKHEFLVFPRYHQFEAIQELENDILKKNSNNYYLIEHSTGSGKSLTIGWLAHRLVSLHTNDQKNTNIFDSVIVITDRKNLDKQITNTLLQLQSTPGIVGDTMNLSSKELKEYLIQGKKIIVSTIQKFGVISRQIKDLKSKNFAVIIDEVHSSQEGKYNTHLKVSLSDQNILQKGEGEEISDLTDIDKILLEEIQLHGKLSHISYFGFSGTPKDTTLAIFGTKIDNQDKGGYKSFHKYSMSQSIREGFTLDVLKNYTTYRRFFKLVSSADLTDQKNLPVVDVKKALINHVDLSEKSIDEKTKIILEHFKAKVFKKIKNQAKAMLVCKSRLHCVLYKQAFDRLLKEQNLNFECLVAFTNKVEIEHLNQTEVYDENNLNNLLNGSIEENFKNPKYRILIVNNKFQTGFDEPLLHTMYVDKKLKDLQCVQTLSRLNRNHKFKDDVFILDFVNEISDIKNAFQKFYNGVFIDEDVDEGIIYKLKFNIEKINIFSEEDINQLIDYDYSKNRENIFAVLERVSNRFSNLSVDDRKLMKSNLFKFISFYEFLINIISFKDVTLYKFYRFCFFLIRKLPSFERESLPNFNEDIDITNFKIQHQMTVQIQLEDSEHVFDPIDDNESLPREEEKDNLENIIKSINTKYGTIFNENERLILDSMQKKLNGDNDIINTIKADNTEENKKYVVYSLLEDMFQETFNDNIDLYKKICDPKVNKNLKEYFYNHLKG